MAATKQELAYETAVTAVNRQEELAQLRSRTGMLLAAGSLVASFFGATALGQEGTGAWSWLAVTTFVLSFVGSIYLLAPKEGLGFALNGPRLFEQLKGKRLDQAHLQTAVWLQGARDQNQPIIDRLNRVFAGTCVALVLEVVFWTAALRGTI